MAERDDEKIDVSIHILPTAANLLGICFLVFSFISVLKLRDQTLLDELVAVAIVVFLFASLASYASLRSKTAHGFYRKAADILFVVGLCFLTLASLAIVLKIIA
jgi:hypothetical protein